MRTTIISQQHIDENAFAGRDDIEHLHLAGVWSVGPGAFSRCKNLQSVICSDGPAVICEKAFSDCKRLESVVFFNGLRTIAERAFCGTSIRRLELPASLRIIGNSCFENCTSLESVSFPTSLDLIGSSAFSGCNALSDFQIPEIDVLHDGCFAGTSVRSVTIPASVSYIGRDVFSGCGFLCSVTFCNERTLIKKTSFQFCPAMRHIVILHASGEEHRVFDHCATQLDITGKLASFDRTLTYGPAALFRLAFPYGLSPENRNRFAQLILAQKQECASYASDMISGMRSSQQNALLQILTQFSIPVSLQN